MSDLEYERRFGFWPRIKNAFRVLLAFTFSHVGVCGLVVSYMIAGVFLFRQLEKDFKNPYLDEVIRNRSATASLLLDVALKYNILDKENFTAESKVIIKKYAEFIVDEVGRGYDGDNSDSAGTGKGVGDHAWNEMEAFLYSLTVITTIGYGNVVPKSDAGKIATIIYGIIGMPLFLLYLSNIGDIFARGFKWTFARCCQCRWNCIKPRRYFEDDELDGEPQTEEQITVPITLCLAVMVSYIWGGGFLFAYFEKWELLDASYFCFISLSTIGFGDYVPSGSIAFEQSEKENSYVEILCSLYLLIGMALIAMCFQLMQEEVVATVRKIGSRLGCA